MASSKEIAQKVLDAVGGKDNVIQVTHCITRLRFNLKDPNFPDDVMVKKLPGVAGVVKAGGQYQVVIGQNVSKVYADLCDIGGFTAQSAACENLDGPKEKLTLKKIGSNILDYLSGSMIQVIPILIAASMFRTITSLCGPQLLNLFSADSDIYILLDFVYDAGFYFMPIMLGYSAAKKLGTSPVLGMYLGAILIAPDLLNLVTEGTAFTVFGISVPLINYTQSVVPILLCVPVMAVIEKFLKKHIPTILTTILVPLLTLLIMLPISFCLLAPLGSTLGNYIGTAVVWIGQTFGFVGVGIVSALWQLMVLTGMHTVVQVSMIGVYMQQGYINGPFLGMAFSLFATFGCAFGAFLRIRDKGEKGTAFGCFVSGIIGGVTEPTIFGVCMKYKRTWLGLMAGAAAGGIYGGITHVRMAGAGASNFLVTLGFTQFETSNMVNGFIGVIIAFVVAAVVTYLFGFSKKDLAVGE